jgi:hypothetical protein
VAKGPRPHVPAASHAGPAGAGGLLAKIGAALTAKVGLGLRALDVEQPQRRLVLAHEQRLHLVERRHDERRLNLGWGQLDDDHEAPGQLGLVVGRQVERFRLEDVRLRERLVGKRLGLGRLRLGLVAGV